MTIKLNKLGSWTQAWIGAAVIAGLYLCLCSRATLWDRDEPRFARATVEMLETGNYLVPTFNGELRPDKPILIYWLMAMPVSLLGPTELACRFCGAVGTAVTCLLMFFIAVKLFDAAVGLWTMGILATSLMVLYIGTAATADAVLLPFMVGQMAVYVGFFHSPKRFVAIGLLGLAMGGALLAKGPVGLLPVVTILCMMLLTKRHRPGQWRCWELGLSVCLGIGLFLAWALPANAATDGEFFRLGIGHHVLQRSFSPLEHHGGTFLLYIPVILIGFFPWTLYLPGLIAFLKDQQLAQQVTILPFRALFLSWTLPVLIIMSLVATKLPHYILFMWPMLALGVAAMLVSLQRNLFQPNVKLWLKRSIWLFLPIAALGVIGLLVIPWLEYAPEMEPLEELLWPGLAGALVLGGMAVVAIRQLSQGAFLSSAKALVVGTIVFQLLLVVGMIPVLEQIKISPALAKFVKTQATDSTAVATYEYEEPTLNFYIGRQLTHLKSDDDVLNWVTTQGTGLLILPRSVLERLNLTGLSGIHEVGYKAGFNYVNGKCLEVVVVNKTDKGSLPQSSL